MQATLTSKGQITIPAEVRRKLGLKPGQKLAFDLDAPFLKAEKVLDENIFAKYVGSRKGEFGDMTTRQVLDMMRGPVDLPAKGRRKPKA